MKIAFFNYLLLEYGGGTEKFFIEITSGLQKRYPNLDIDIFTFGEKLSKKILFLYSLYFFKHIDKRLLHKERSKNIFKKLNQVNYYKIDKIKDLRRKLVGYDFIYVKNDIIEVLILKLLLKGKAFPRIIFGFHTPVYYPLTGSIQSKIHNILYDSLIFRYCINNARILHVVNTFDEQLLKKRFPKKRIIKVYNPFNFDSFENNARNYKYKFNWNKNKINILWVGRLTEQKGVDDLILIINRINSSRYKDKIIWNIVGDGELRDKVLDLKNKVDNFNYFGYIKSKYMASIYKNNNLFISTSKWESFPYNILEAQCCGLPVISYNIHGSNEIISDKKSGYLVKDLDQFIQKILLTLSNAKFNKDDIKTFIRTRFNQEILYSKLYEMFKNN